MSNPNPGGEHGNFPLLRVSARLVRDRKARGPLCGPDDVKAVAASLKDWFMAPNRPKEKGGLPIIADEFINGAEPTRGQLFITSGAYIKPFQNVWGVIP